PAGPGERADHRPGRARPGVPAMNPFKRFSVVAAGPWAANDPQAGGMDGAHLQSPPLAIALARLALHADPSLRPRLFSGFATDTSFNRTPWRGCGIGDVSLS